MHAVGVRFVSMMPRGTSAEFELAKLADLHDRGVITDAEFEQRKEEIQS